jgi:glycosyltransferase involved in cell wall biosynthesis
MKRIVILLPFHWSAMQGGAEYQARLICQHLVASGRFEVHWVSRHIHPDFQAKGYTVHKIGERHGLRSKAFFFDHLALSRLLREIRPDVIYQRVGSAYTGIAAYHAMQNNCRMIWHVASDMDVIPFNVKDWRPSTLLKYIDKRYLEYGVRHASDIVVQTHDQNRLLGVHFGRQATMLIRNLHPLPAEPIDKNSSPNVLWIANLKPAKQPEVFMRLVRSCMDMPQVRFMMIGEPWLDVARQRAFEKTVASIPNLSYLGKLPIEEVNALLERAHLFVNTSLVEGFANTFIQAWMRQVPVLSLNVDPDGLLTSEGIGFCADGDEAVLLHTLREWLVDASLREEIGQCAQVYAEAHHSERNIENLLELMER